MKDDQIYRITYEAFSKFSNSLIRSRSFEEVKASLKINLKYLFNFYVFRISYHWEDYFIHITITSTEATVEVLSEEAYLPHEQILLDQKRPQHWIHPELPMLPAGFVIPDEENAELWGWLFENDDRQIVVSLLSGKSKDFSRRNVTFVRLVAESLESKLLELCLFQVLDKKNAVISTINQQQQEIITQRTQEIAAKNQRLLEISILNAHQVREPLSRILGLVQVTEYCKSLEDLQTKILPRLKKSSQDLDLTLREVIDKAGEELVNLKAN